jgi:hypothetical protein
MWTAFLADKRDYFLFVCEKGLKNWLLGTREVFINGYRSVEFWLFTADLNHNYRIKRFFSTAD